MDIRLALAALATACHPQGAHQPAAASPGPCALVVTDDDIPSGSATAGALYVDDAEQGRALLTADVVDVVEGLRAGGTQCVHVLDGHDGALDPEPLAALDVALLTPSTTADWTWPFLGPMQQPYALAALVGFHSNAGQIGFRAHTINDAVLRLRIQGQELGEVGHLALGLGAFNVPVGLVTGDMNATAEAEALVPGVQTVTVRWLEADGCTGFLDREQAAEALQTAARAAVLDPPAPYQTATPVKLSLTLRSPERLDERAPDLAASWVETATGLGLSHTLLDHARALQGVLSWQTNDALTAYATGSHAAWFLRPAPGAWDEVSRGYAAYTNGQHELALAAYDEALAMDPHDAATWCRRAAVHQAMGDLEAARAGFEHGFQRLDQLSEPALQSWCSEGLAEVALAQGDARGARRAALQLLALPPWGSGRSTAGQVLAATDSGARWPDAGGLEGFYPWEQLSAEFLDGRGIPLPIETLQARFERVGKLELSVGEATLTPEELLAERQAFCGTPRARAFNPARCEAYEDARCDEQGCFHPAYRNCSGLFAAPGLFVTAAHCTMGWDEDPDLMAAARLLRPRLAASGWTIESHAIQSALPLKRSWEDAWVIHEPDALDRMDAAALRYASSDDFPAIEPAAVPDIGEPLWILGFPRNRTRPVEAMDEAGYDLVFGEPSASFGRVREPNRELAPLCSTTGDQDDWRPQSPCPSEIRLDPQGEEAQLGLISEAPFLADMDTTNGYSGAPIFDAEGRWVGVMVTIYGADPREAFVPQMRPVAIQAEAVMQALEQAWAAEQ